MERDDARAVVAVLLPKYQSGDRGAFSALVAAVQRELRRSARELRGGGDAPGLEAGSSLASLYARMVDALGVPQDGRAAFLQVCARAMRVSVVDDMRTPAGLSDPRSALVLAVDDLLEVIARYNPRLVRVVEGLYFASMPEGEVARALGIGVADVGRDWRRARTWLVKELPSYSPSAQDRDLSVPNAAWVDAIFDDALGLPPAKRASFLDQCSSVSPNLRRDVDELLRLSDQPLPGLEPGALSDDLLMSLLAGAVSAPGPVTFDLPEHETAPAPGKAERGTAEGKTVRRSIGAEGQAASPLLDDTLEVLKRLSHPRIARVLETARDGDGRPFLVMERVEGHPIDRYCDQERLSIDARLDLFLDVCGAVQYGHRKLVAHGAIEPANVVVTAGGDVKLREYGIAPLQRAASGGGAVWTGSPEYASPEQRRGEPATVASDVYQLGLLLYQLLTGEPAHPPGGSPPGAATVKVVPPSVRVSQAPEKHAVTRRVRPRALSGRLRGDLDAIVMYALRQDPERRYPSVSALRSDVQRHRGRRPIWIRSDDVLYRAGRFLVRRRAAVAAVVVAAVGAAVLLPSPVRDRVRQGQRDAQVAKVEQVLGTMLGTAGSSVEAPNALQFIEQSAQMARTELASEPGSRARLLTAAGRAYGALGHYEHAIATLEEALAIRRAQFGDDSLEVADTLAALGHSEHMVGRYEESETSLRAVVAVRRIRAGASHASTIGAAIDLAGLLHTRGALRDAETMLRSVVTSLRPEVVRAGPDALATNLLPRALRQLADVLRDRGVVGESATLYREAITMFDQRGAEDAPELPLARIELARLLIAREELDAAHAELAIALPAMRDAHPGEHPHRARALQVEARLRMAQARHDEAGARLAESHRMLERLLGRMHPAAVAGRGVQAELHRRQGALVEAVAGARQALDEYDRLGLQDHPSTIEVRLTLGQALIATGAHAEALRVLASALATAERHFVRYDSRIMHIQSTMTSAARASL